jgi:multicomponent Na+:H+ antiporter subunit E
MGGQLRHYVQLALLLGGVWLLWSFHFTPLLLTFGGLSILLVLWIAKRMRIMDREAVLVDLKNVQFLLYLPWIAWEVVKSNVDVARVIIHPKLPIEPRMMRVRASQHTALGKVIFANSITLTPGTVTVDFDEADSSILVHALTRTAYDGLMTGKMDGKVREMEKDD